MAVELEKTYNPKEIEEKIYRFWEKKKLFLPKRKKKKNFVICFPPPNVTGELHMGHALNGSLQDFLIRKRKMEGFNTLFSPGVDHAGIAAQVKVEKKLMEEGMTRWELGKEKFLERVWQWKEEYTEKIKNQLKKLGLSMDWSRFRFTMDQFYTKSVIFAFSRYWKKGLIFFAKRPVNFCKRCQTALSDLEVEYKEEKGKLYYVAYPLKEKRKEKSFIVVATTRPETMLGDTAVAVHSSDKRYKKLVGKFAILPFLEREIPIISDQRVDPKFGTGAVKITPAHDFLDYEISLSHNLPMVSAISKGGKMEGEIPEEFLGLDVEACRQKIVERLKEKGLLRKVEDYEISTPFCYRCETKIEILPTSQIFLKMKSLAQKAKKVVKLGKIKFLPKRFEKTFFDWIESQRDWCLSRQIWWGHQIPLFECQNEKKYFFSEGIPKKCQICKKCNPKQVEDVFDTWFSSALWPFAVFGWPKETQDFKQFFPTDFIVTGRDIINLWISRMIFSSLELTGKIPFKFVLVHPTILTKEGKRMSKSLGTGIDPMVLIENYGADSTRFSLFWQFKGTQDIRFDENVVIGGRKFLNKIWNAARFLLLTSKKKSFSLNLKKLTKREKEIFEKFKKDLKKVNKKIDEFQFGQALEILYHSFWHQFCDKWLEEFKKSSQISLEFLYFIFKNYLLLLHPFLPFITEKIYQILPILPKSESILFEKWPKF